MKPTVRIIDGKPYVLVETVGGKYRPELVFWRCVDNKLWALLEDMKRLGGI